MAAIAAAAAALAGPSHAVLCDQAGRGGDGGGGRGESQRRGLPQPGEGPRCALLPAAPLPRRLTGATELGAGGGATAAVGQRRPLVPDGRAREPAGARAPPPSSLPPPPFTSHRAGVWGGARPRPLRGAAAARGPAVRRRGGSRRSLPAPLLMFFFFFFFFPCPSMLDTEVAASPASGLSGSSPF